MSTNVLVIGQSGTGKSTSLRTMDDKSTFLINVINKPLPFRGWKDRYKAFSKSDLTGNILVTDDTAVIIKTLRWLSEKRPEIKTIAIDDFHYVMVNQFMRKAAEKGYEKFTQIALDAWSIIKTAQELRDDLTVVLLSHSDESETGNIKCKTIGRMLDDKITLEGMFTVVLRTIVKDGKYFFATKNSGHDTVKSPMGMFEAELIDNDLAAVVDAIQAY